MQPTAGTRVASYSAENVMKPDPKPSDTLLDEKVVHAPAAKTQPHLDDLLDEALEETFPGSDPVSISQPRKSRADKRMT
jgi:hypothetical protein